MDLLCPGAWVCVYARTQGLGGALGDGGDPCSLSLGLRSQSSLFASALPWPWLPGSHRTRPRAGLVALETNVLQLQIGSLGHQQERGPGNPGPAWECVGRGAGQPRAGLAPGVTFDLGKERWESRLGDYDKIGTLGLFKGDRRNLGIGG